MEGGRLSNLNGELQGAINAMGRRQLSGGKTGFFESVEEESNHLGWVTWHDFKTPIGAIQSQFIYL